MMQLLLIISSTCLSTRKISINSQELSENEKLILVALIADVITDTLEILSLWTHMQGSIYHINPYLELSSVLLS